MWTSLRNAFAYTWASLQHVGLTPECFGFHMGRTLYCCSMDRGLCVSKIVKERGPHASASIPERSPCVSKSISDRGLHKYSSIPEQSSFASGSILKFPEMDYNCTNRVSRNSKLNNLKLLPNTNITKLIKHCTYLGVDPMNLPVILPNQQETQL